jgi:hypothetical protein
MKMATNLFSTVKGGLANIPFFGGGGGGGAAGASGGAAK